METFPVMVLHFATEIALLDLVKMVTIMKEMPANHAYRLAVNVNLDLFAQLVLLMFFTADNPMELMFFIYFVELLS